MMLKRILTLCTPNGTAFLTAGTLSTTKVIFRAFSQGIETAEKWDLFSAVCLERHPLVTKPMQDIEARYHDMLQQIAFENSLMSDFEIRENMEKKENKKILSKTSDHEKFAIETVQDFIDANEQELQTFPFASRISEDDAVVSLNRKLDKSLMLLVEQRMGNTSFWIPPQSVRKHEESMIQTAHRTMQELCGNNVKVNFYGNAPIGFYKYKYPKDLQDKGRNGAKVFYFLAKYISGDISSNIKHCWLDRKELEKVVPPNVHKSLSKFLLPD